MNIQEVAEYLSVKRKERLENAVFGEIKEMVKDNEHFTTIELNEKAIVEALEKQIPNHIEEQTEDDREFIDYVCPNCKTTLQQKMKGVTRTTIYKYKHCIFCGQSLDWSDHPTEKGGGQG